jgi:hypothetical protein
MIRRSLARVPTLSTSTWAALTVVAWALVVGQFAIDGAGGIVVGAAGLALHLALLFERTANYVQSKDGPR